MKTIDLFVKKNDRWITNIPDSYIPSKLTMLKTRYMTLTSVDDDRRTGLDIQLRHIDLIDGRVKFEICKYGHAPTSFKLGFDDDPIIIFADDKHKMEKHVFERVYDCKINQEIKPGGLYKFRNPFTDVGFLAVVQSVGYTFITLNKLDVIQDGIYKPTLYSLQQQKNIFNINTSDKVCVDEFKNYVVTELCDLNIVFP